MADRTVNININYKVNTADVQKAAQTAQAAQKATDQLRKSTQQYGTEGAKAGKQAADGLKQTTQAANQATGSTQNLNKQFSNLYTTIKAVVAAGLVREVVSTAVEMARLAGNTQGVERAFNRTFQNGVEIMADLRKATHGTITDFELMQRTLQATNLGVSVERLPELFEFATVRAQQTGESVDYLVDSIVRGIGRKSPLILDNLGLSAVRLKEKFEGAALASQSVADVTEAVAEIAREEMDKMGGYVTTGATKVDMLTVSWKELKTELSEKFDSSGVVSFLNEAVDGFRQMIKSGEEVKQQAAETRALTEVNSLKEFQIAKDRFKNQQDLGNAIQNEIRSRMSLIEHGQVELEIIKQKLSGLQGAESIGHKQFEINQKIRKELASEGLNVQGNLKFYNETVKLLRAYFQEVTKIKEAEGGESTGIVERKRKEIEALQEQIEKTNRLGDLGAGGKLISQLEIAQAELADLLRAFREFHIKEFKTEIDTASAALSNFGEVKKRIDADLRDGIELPPIQTPPPTYTETFWDLLKGEVEDNWKEITSVGIDIQSDQLKSLAEAELNSMQARLGAIRDFYNEQQLLAGDNERAKTELRVKEEREVSTLQRKIFEKEKQTRRSQALIDGAAGVVKAFATYPYPAAIVISALIAAQTASQIAIINRQRAGFKKGIIGIKGPGTGTSDSIPVNISRGESVIRADRTEKSKTLLTAINEGRLNDKQISHDVLNKLHLTGEGVKYAGMDDTRIVNELRKLKFPDYMAHQNLLFEVNKSADGLHKKIRLKSMG